MELQGRTEGIFQEKVDRCRKVQMEKLAGMLDGYMVDALADYKELLRKRSAGRRHGMRSAGRWIPGRRPALWTGRRLNFSRCSDGKRKSAWMWYRGCFWGLMQGMSIGRSRWSRRALCWM